MASVREILTVFPGKEENLLPRTFFTIYVNNEKFFDYWAPAQIKPEKTFPLPPPGGGNPFFKTTQRGKNLKTGQLRIPPPTQKTNIAQLPNSSGLWMR